MLGNYYQPSPPRRNPSPMKPWHPETLQDIRNLNLNGFGLPFVRTTYPRPVFGGWQFHMELSGSVDFVKQQMEQAFYQYPAVGFVESDGTVLVYRKESEIER